MRCNLCKKVDPGDCSLRYCPIFRPTSYSKMASSSSKDSYSGQSPSVFVGSFGYPRLNVGILGNENVTTEYDDPNKWVSKKHGINEIIDLRSGLINSRQNQSIKSFNSRFMEICQEISQSIKETDVDVSLNKKPKFDVSLSKFRAPHGPSVELKSVQVTSNPKIPKKIDSIVSDTDLKATSAISDLSKKGIDEHKITKMFSVGTLGMKVQRKLVPTRWSITAVDDTITKLKMKEIKENVTSGYKSYFGGYLGNYFLILLFDQPWSYELFEMHEPSGGCSTDFEPYFGRKDYPKNTVGGYFACKHAILERLIEDKKQAGILALRFITDEYYAPLGVWVVRQAARDAMKHEIKEYESWKDMLVHAVSIITKRFGLSSTKMLQDALKSSILLKNHREQKSLKSYF